MLVTETLYRMVDYFGTDARRINHALKVNSFARLVGQKEGVTADVLEIIDLSSILHDIGIPISEQKYGSCIGKYQEIEGPPIAHEILESLGASTEIIDRVCYLIGNHHTYTKIDGIDFQILVEADFLVNIFEDEMSESAIKSARDKYFKTETGKFILDRMYLTIALVP
jgi:HD superfamily phosphodiesterase